MGVVIYIAMYDVLWTWTMMRTTILSNWVYWHIYHVFSGVIISFMFTRLSIYINLMYTWCILYASVSKFFAILFLYGCNFDFDFEIVRIRYWVVKITWFVDSKYSFVSLLAFIFLTCLIASPYCLFFSVHLWLECGCCDIYCDVWCRVNMNDHENYYIVELCTYIYTMFVAA